VVFAAAAGETLSFFNHNEHMYVAAGALVAQGRRLYQDFAYLQAPYLPLLYGAVAAVSPGSNLYFAAKLVSISAAFLSGTFVFLLARWIAKDLWVAVMCAALLLTNASVLRSVSECSNYATPMAALFGSYYLFCIAGPASGRSQSLVAIVAAGVLASIAAGLKAYYALPALGMVCVSLFHHGGLDFRSRVRLVTLPFAAGLLLGAIPIAYYAMADFDAFIFNNFGYHELNVEWRKLGPKRKAFGIAARLDYIAEKGSLRTNLFLVGAMVGSALLALYDKIRPGAAPVDRGEDRHGWSAALLLLAGCLGALTPRPIHVLYFALPLSLAVVLLAAGSAQTSASTRMITRGFLALMLAGSLWVGGSKMSGDIAVLGNPERWASERMAAKANEIRSHFADQSGAIKGASLSPIPLLSADVRIYDELSTGPFLFRVGDLLSAEERQRFVATSPSSIAEFLERDPPDLIYGGGEKGLDSPLFDYAKHHGYRESRLQTGGRLFVRP